jgi:hypothetical protein
VSTPEPFAGRGIEAAVHEGSVMLFLGGALSSNCWDGW